MYNIALVEDEKNLASLVIKYLSTEGWKVTWYKTGEEAQQGISEAYDLWILDIMLPGILNGYDLIKAIRSENEKKPVIFTSARSQDIDKIMGLELGSDDYLAKPYSIRELVLRVKNLLTRTYQWNEIKTTTTLEVINGYTIDRDRRSVSVDKEVLTLTSKEYDLLLFFVDHHGKAFDRDQILNAVWGDDYFGSDRVEIGRASCRERVSA